MGDNMKKLLNKIKYDKKVMTILNVITIIGIITGSIFITILNKTDKKLISDAVNNYLSHIKSINNLELIYLKNILINNTISLFLTWIIGISVIGVFFVLIFIFYKSFILGFSISALIYTYSYKGIFISLIYIFPHIIINLLIFMFVASYSLKLSSILIRSILKKENMNFKSFINNYIKIFIFSLIFIIMTSIYESIILPIIFKFMLGIIL